MEVFKQLVDKQLSFNRGKNLFHKDFKKLFGFVELSPEVIREIKLLENTAVQSLIEYITNNVQLEFGKVNQYYAFDTSSLITLRKIYHQLFTDLKHLNSELDQQSLESIEEKHYARLKMWLTLTNDFAKELYSNDEPYLEEVPCFEYSAELQLQLLGIVPEKLKAPVLDVGCGREAQLVLYLRSKGIEAIGIDRFADNSDFLYKNDWLEYVFVENSWGTIISHLGFSNHFNHHHLRSNGNYITYARKYMEILHSLLPGGCFYYAPGLEFIESYLDTDRFVVERSKIEGYNFNAVKITRVK